MLGVMTARCNQCGHENNPEYRFCGICGAPLQPAIATREPGRERVPSSLSGPSFLGLGDERSRDLDYLLEDEPPRGHGRLYLALLLLVLSGALLAWHWQRDGYPWAGPVQRPTVRSTPANSATDASPPPGPVAPVQPTGNSVPPEAQAATGTGPGEAAQPAAAPQPGTPSQSPTTAATAPEPTPAPKEGPDSGESAAKPVTVPAPATAAPPTSASMSASQETETTENPAPKAAAPVPIAKVAVPKPSPATPPVSFDDRLVADGERYLYGRGVPEDCARAQRNLQIGAGNSNPKAQTLLGAMYATGHCVNRDLPTAYRWFAKALHGDPGNSRVQRDLEVLWKQMTPEERQLAMKSR
jgi:hypothetical protein